MTQTQLIEKGMNDELDFFNSHYSKPRGFDVFWKGCTFNQGRNAPLRLALGFEQAEGDIFFL